jgi:hypothetical protein
MNPLRDLLKAKRPDLFNALENAWQIAEKDFFPLMTSSDESLNSSLHSKNLENYLNSILDPYPQLFEQKSPVFLSPHELYCLLMAILFHDSGRILTGKAHGYLSKHYIQRNWVKFFIPSEDLADAIGDICEFHKPLEIKPDPPSAIILDAGDGVIRVWELSALLVLIDEMDTTYRRLKTLYALDQVCYVSDKAAFRNYIKSVTYRHSDQCIIVSIDNKIDTHTDTSSFLDSILHKEKHTEIPLKHNDSNKIPASDNLFDYFYNKFTSFLNITDNGKESFAKIKEASVIVDKERDSDFEIKLNLNIDNRISNLGIRSDKTEKRIDFLTEIRGTSKTDQKVKLYYNYLLSETPSDHFISDLQKVVDTKWPLYDVLSAIVKAMNDCFNNTVGNIKPLARLGIECKTWLLCYKEHLYNVDGNETFEPIFTSHYLSYVFQCMSRLSQQVFASSWFSYEVLASSVLEEDVNKIKLAVQRIDVLSRQNKPVISINECLIHYDSTKWKISSYPSSTKLTFSQMNDIILNTKTP